MGPAQFSQGLEPLKHPALRGGGVSGAVRQLPPHLSPVEVAAVLRLVGVVFVAVVVELGQLVPAVQQGQAGLHEHHGVEGQVKPHRPLHGGLIFLAPRLLNAAQGGGGAALAGVAAGRVGVVQLPPADAVRGQPLEVVA